MDPDPPIIDYARPPGPREGPLPWWMKAAASLAFVILAWTMLKGIDQWQASGQDPNLVDLGVWLVAIVLEVVVMWRRSVAAAAILAALWFVVPMCCLSPGVLYFAHDMTRLEIGRSALTLLIPVTIGICHVIYALGRAMEANEEGDRVR